MVTGGKINVTARASCLACGDPLAWQAGGTTDGREACALLRCDGCGREYVLRATLSLVKGAPCETIGGKSRFEGDPRKKVPA